MILSPDFEYKPILEMEALWTSAVALWNVEVSRTLGLPKSPATVAEAHRLIGETDMLFNAFTNALLYRPGDSPGITEQLQRATLIVTQRLKRLEKYVENSPADSNDGTSDLERELIRKPSLLAVINEMETSTSKSDIRDAVFSRVISAKLRDLIDSPESRAASWTAADQANFKSLIEDAFEPLIEFTLFTSGTLSFRDTTVKDATKVYEIMKAGGTRSAASFNHELNQNPLVGSLNTDAEMRSDNMGIIQMIEFVMYQLMKDLDSGYGFNRSEAYGDNACERLIDLIAANDWTVYAGSPPVATPLNIQGEFSKFPAEAQQLIKHIAMVKAARDDIGQLASNYIMFAHGKSPKLRNTGSNAKQWAAGKLARMVYDVANTSHKGTNLVGFAFIDPSEIKVRRTSLKVRRRGDPIGPELKPTDNMDLTRVVEQKKHGAVKYELGAEGDPRALVLQRLMTYLDVTFDSEHKGYIPNARKGYAGKLEHWYSDFPPIGEVMNRDLGAKNANITDYEAAEHAFITLYDAAVRSTGEGTPLDPVAAQTKINTFLRPLFTDYAKLMGYIGNGQLDTEEEFQKYIEFHRIPRAAYKFIFFNLINSLPSPSQSKLDKTWNRFVNLKTESEDDKLINLRINAVQTIITQIKAYSSLGKYSQEGTCAHELISFLTEPVNPGIPDGPRRPASWLVNPPFISNLDRAQEFNIRRVVLEGINNPSNDQLNQPPSRFFSLEDPPALKH